MSELGYGWAVVLGVIQGLTEFLPVSSSAHLALSQGWMGLNADSLPMLLFDCAVHIGTVISIFVVFHESIRGHVGRLISESSRSWTGPRSAWRIVSLAVVASIPTAVIGLTFKPTFEAAFGSPRSIGVGLLVTAGLLAATALVGRGRRGWKRFQFWQAALIGVAQGIAILPGVSRSGSTICTATFMGLRRRWAAEFSFYLAIPAILGATVIKLMDALQLGSAVTALPWGPIFAAAVVSMLVGIVALRLLLGAVRRAKLHYFAVYCLLLACAVLWGPL